jgi:hypothetical protein
MSRTLPSLVALAIVALLGVACSNVAAQTGTTSGGGASDNDASRQQAVKFSECMRANGVKQFPDPDASGELTIDAVANGSGVDTNSAAFTQAIAACKDLQPPGFVGQKRTAQEQEAALKFAQCVRDNGVKDFPDPAPDGPLIDTDRIPSAAGRGGNSIPGLREAMQKCRDLAGSAGVVGAR